MLIDDLVVPVLATAIRAVHTRQRPVAANQIALIVNVLSRSQSPQVTYTALMVMPWIDSDTAARHGDLWLLDALHHRLTRAPFNRPIQYTHAALGDAGGLGYFHVLEWWKRHVGLPKYNLKGVMDKAASAGRLDVIEWWAEEFPTLDEWGEPVLQGILTLAAQHGHMHILSFFEQAQEHKRWSGAVQVGCLPHIVASAHAHVLDWFLDRMHIDLDPSPLQFPGHDQRMVQDAMMVACALGKQAALDKLLDQFGQVFTPNIAAFACAAGNLAYIKHCARQLGSEAINSPLTYHLASAFGHIHVIDWLEVHQVTVDGVRSAPFGCFTASAKWYDALAPFEHMAPLAALVRMTHSSDSQSPLLAACATGRVDVLESKWDVWDGKAVRMEAAQVASEFGQVPILVWLHQHGHICGSMEYEVLINDCLNQASARGHVCVLQWWRDCGWTSLYMQEPLSVRTAVSHGQVNVLDWWMANVPAGLSGIPATAGSWGALAQLATEAGHASVLEQILQRRGPAQLREEWDRIQFVCSLFDAVELSTPGMALFDSLWWLMHSDLDTSQVQVDIIYGAAGECAAFWNPLLLDMCRRAGYLKRSINLDRVILASMSVLVLEWAAAYSKLALEYTHEALTSLTKETCIPILEWWKHSGLPVKLAVEDLQEAHFDDAIRTWWLESGLL